MKIYFFPVQSKDYKITYYSSYCENPCEYEIKRICEKRMHNFQDWLTAEAGTSDFLN